MGENKSPWDYYVNNIKVKKVSTEEEKFEFTRMKVKEVNELNQEINRLKNEIYNLQQQVNYLNGEIQEIHKRKTIIINSNSNLIQQEPIQDHIKDLVIELVNKGSSYRAVALEVGISKSSVGNIINKYKKL